MFHFNLLMNIILTNTRNNLFMVTFIDLLFIYLWYLLFIYYLWYVYRFIHVHLFIQLQFTSFFVQYNTFFCILHCRIYIVFTQNII